MKITKKLPETELKVMLKIWEMEAPVSRLDLSDALAEYGWQDAVQITMLARLCKKGYLMQTKQGRLNFYTPLVTKAEYFDFESNSLTEKTDGMYIQSLMSAFIKAEKLTDNDIRDIEKMIQDYRERHSK